MKLLEKLKDHSLINTSKFIKASDIKVRKIVKKILDNTKYINYKEFIKNLNISIKDLLYYLKFKKLKTAYVYKSIKFNTKSNGWIYNYIKKMFKYLKSNIKLKLINLNNIKKLKNNDIVIFPDDCIYSGLQMSSNINKFIKLKKKNLIYILTPYISSFGINNIKNTIGKKNKLKICKHVNIDKYLIYKYLKINEIAKIEGFYSNLEKKLLNDKYISKFRNVYLLYFNHKLADFISTITLFYMGVVPNNYNKRALIYRTENTIPKLQIIPLINNCNYKKIKINVNNPICPKPPYK